MTDEIAEVGLHPDAIAALRNGQRQLDMDGCEVGVSRQALDELLAWYDTRRPDPRVAALVEENVAFRKTLEVIDVAANAEAKRIAALVEAATALAESCVLRSLRGMDHVPSRRLQQEAQVAVRNALATLNPSSNEEQTNG